MANGDENGVSAEHPIFGKYKIFGQQSLIIIVLAVALGAITWTVMLALHSLSDEHKTLGREMRIQSYLLSLPPDKRPELVPPDDLWERMAGFEIYKRERLKAERLEREKRGGAVQ